MNKDSKRAAIFSSSSHIQDCREYAAREGYTIVAELLEEGRNTSLERQSIQALFTAAKEDRFDAVLIPQLSQLSQENEEVVSIIISLEGHGIRCISITQNILLGGEAGTFTNMVSAIRAKVAEIERERLTARRRAGRRQNSN